MDVSESVITVESLTKRFSRVTALDDLTVDVPAGVVGLVGANGAGKSTLIKILLGLLPATSGRASVLGLDVATEGNRIREQVGYMPEHDVLPPDVSATELIVSLGRLSGLPKTAARERTADILRHVGLYEERYRPIGGYSTGMKQRVKLGQALVHDPRLVFLDEPTNGLDPAGRNDMLALIQRIGAEFGTAVLVTSHLLGELERIADHVVVIDGGRLMHSSSTAQVTGTRELLLVEVTEQAPALAAALTAAGAVAVLRGRMVEVEIGADSIYDLVRDQVVDLGVGLIRIEQRRHRIAEIFRAAGELPGSKDEAHAG